MCVSILHSSSKELIAFLSKKSYKASTSAQSYMHMSMHLCIPEVKPVCDKRSKRLTGKQLDVVCVSSGALIRPRRSLPRP